jgi:PAS domain S-box-containing protein
VRYTRIQKHFATRLLRIPTPVRYAIAIAMVAVATGLRSALNPFWNPLALPFITFYPAVMLSGWLGGLGPGLVATLLSAAVANYFWMAAPFAFSITNISDVAALLLFATMGTLISFLNQAWRRSQAAIAQSEAQLGIMIESIGDAVIATDVRGRITLMNDVAASLTGWKQEAASGMPLEKVFQAIDEHTRQGVENSALRAMRDGAIIELVNHSVLIAKHGTETTIEDSGSPIKDAHGETIGAVLIFRDVTERHRVERVQAELLVSERIARESEHVARIGAETAQRHLELALSAGRMGTWQYTIRSGEVRWSAELAEIHGYAAGSFPGTFDAFRNEIHPDDRERVLRTIGEAIDRQLPHHIEYRIVRKDGSVRWVEGRGQLFLNSAGEPDYMAGICADISERKEAEERLRLAVEAEKQAKRVAEEATRAKDEFLAMLSHELRTPLSAILGWAQILRTGQLPAERARHALEVIERNARIEANLVESLLDLSRIMAGKFKLEMERLDVGAIVVAVVESLRPVAESKGMMIDLSVPPEPVAIIGDGARLQQVFSNLLSNAVKFTPRDGHVRIQVARLASCAQIQVIDDGEGIEAATLPFIFDRFRQAEGPKGRTQGGLGLGLAIVRELVHAHRGTVVAQSEGKGRGSTFTVILPLTAIIPEAIEATTSQMRES